MQQKVTAFDQALSQDPVGDLTLLVRRLRIGDRVELESGIVVRSVRVPRGGSQERRFAVIHPGDAHQRHKQQVLGYGATRNAEAAAIKALQKEQGGTDQN